MIKKKPTTDCRINTQNIEIHRMMYLNNFLKLEDLISLICCNKVCHGQDLRVIFVTEKYKQSGTDTMQLYSSHKNDKLLMLTLANKNFFVYLRFSFLAIKRVNFRLHQHICQDQVPVISERNQT